MLESELGSCAYFLYIFITLPTSDIIKMSRAFFFNCLVLIVKEEKNGKYNLQALLTHFTVLGQIEMCCILPLGQGFMLDGIAVFFFCDVPTAMLSF